MCGIQEEAGRSPSSKQSLKNLKYEHGKSCLQWPAQPHPNAPSTVTWAPLTCQPSPLQTQGHPTHMPLHKLLLSPPKPFPTPTAILPNSTTLAPASAYG